VQYSSKCCLNIFGIKILFLAMQASIELIGFGNFSQDKHLLRLIIAYELEIAKDTYKANNRWEQYAVYRHNNYAFSTQVHANCKLA